MPSGAQVECPGVDESSSRPPGGVVSERELGRALAALLRRLRTADPKRPWFEAAVTEVHHAISSVVEEKGPLLLRVGAGGLSVDGHILLQWSAREDRHLFALFQHGVRQLGFLPGIERDEVRELVGALSTDPNQEVSEEDDLVTLLGTASLPNVQIVVVETFSEGADVAEGLEDFVAACGAISVPGLSLDEVAGAAGVMRLAKEDVRYFQRAELAPLLAKLQEAAGDPALGPLVDRETTEIRERLLESIDCSSRWLAGPAVTLSDGAKPSIRRRVVELFVDRSLAENAERDALEALEELLHERDRLLAAGRPEELVDPLFTPVVEALAVRALSGSYEANSTGVEVLRQLPRERAPHLLAQVAAGSTGSIRARALAALLDGAAEGEGAVAVIAAAAPVLEDLDEDGICAILHSLRRVPARPQAVAFFGAAAASRFRRVRIRAASWFAHVGGDHAALHLGNALRDPESGVRHAALSFLGLARRDLAPALLSAWLGGKPPKSSSLDEKRVAAVLYASAARKTGAETLRGLAAPRGLFSRGEPELQAAAVAGLGTLVDEASVQTIEGLASGRGANAVVQQEAQHVLSAFEDGRLPYPDPTDTLTQWIHTDGSVRDVHASRPDVDTLVATKTPSTLPPESTRAKSKRWRSRRQKPASTGADAAKKWSTAPPPPGSASAGAAPPAPRLPREAFTAAGALAPPFMAREERTPAMPLASPLPRPETEPPASPSQRPPSQRPPPRPGLPPGGRPGTSRPAPRPATVRPPMKPQVDIVRSRPSPDESEGAETLPDMDSLLAGYLEESGDD